MVVEFIDIAVGALEGAAFLPVSAGSAHRNNVSGQSSLNIGMAALAGAGTGLFASTQKQAMIGSLLTGAVVPLLGHGRKTGMSIAISAITSTAIGLVTYEAKNKWQHREMHKEADAKQQR